MKVEIFFIAIALCFMFYASVVHAATMESDRFRIEQGNINIGGRKVSSDSFDLSISLGQTSAQDFQSNGFIVKSGFQYIHSPIPFSFSISDTSIDLGAIKANEFSKGSADLEVSYGAAGKYEVQVLEEGPLRSQDGKYEISDTQCNTGKETCLENVAKLWNDQGKYGFGYNMKGMDIPKDFKSTDYFRPFPDNLIDEDPAIIMSSYNVGKRRKATITLKTNVSDIQPAGTYQTVLNFLAIPSF